MSCTFSLENIRFNFIKTIVHLKVYVFLDLTVAPVNPADLAGNKARV